MASKKPSLRVKAMKLKEQEKNKTEQLLGEMVLELLYLLARHEKKIEELRSVVKRMNPSADI